MATFYTDPRITMAGQRQPESPFEVISRYAQLKAMLDDSRARQAESAIRQKEGSLRLAELERLTNEQAAVRTAQAAGARPATAVQMPGEMPGVGSVQTPAYTDRSAVLAKLNEVAPHLQGQAQRQFAQEDFTNAEQRMKLAEQAAKMTKEQLAVVGQKAGLMASLAMSVLQAPAEIRGAIYQDARNAAIQNRLATPEQLPAQYSPQMDAVLQHYATQGMAVKDVVEEAGRNARAARPVPGRDVPLPPAVEGQKKRIAEAGKVSDEDSMDVYASNLAAGRIQITDVPARIRGKVLAAVEKSGNIVVPKPVRATLEQMDKAEGIVDIIEKTYGALERAAGPKALAEGTLDTVLAKLQSNPDAQMMRTQVGLLGNLARSISAERGVLTDRDVERAMQLLPQLTDRADVAKRKIEQLRGFIQNARRAATSSMNKTFTKSGEGAPSGTVRMIAPDGTEADVPAAQVAAAEAAGAKRKP